MSSTRARFPVSQPSTTSPVHPCAWSVPPGAWCWAQRLCELFTLRRDKHGEQGWAGVSGSSEGSSPPQRGHAPAPRFLPALEPSHSDFGVTLHFSLAPVLGRPIWFV